jgi:hypothetical protein
VPFNPEYFAGAEPRQIEQDLAEVLAEVRSEQVKAVVLMAGLKSLLEGNAKGADRVLLRLCNSAERPLPTPLVAALRALRVPPKLRAETALALALVRWEVAADRGWLREDVDQVLERGEVPDCDQPWFHTVRPRRGSLGWVGLKSTSAANAIAASIEFASSAHSTAAR